MNKTLKMTVVTILAALGIVMAYRALFIRTAGNRESANIGMAPNDVTAAHFRWALFEEWANSRPQYKGWESDPEIFKKANEEFKNKIQASVKVLE